MVAFKKVTLDLYTQAPVSVTGSDSGTVNVSPTNERAGHIILCVARGLATVRLAERYCILLTIILHKPIYIAQHMTAAHATYSPVKALTTTAIFLELDEAIIGDVY